MTDVTEPVAPDERAARGPLALYLSDFPRAVGGFGFYFATRSLLRARAPRGDGHPVLILPGLLAGDASTLVLRRYLRRLGYEAHGWGSAATSARRPKSCTASRRSSRRSSSGMIGR